MSSRDKIKKYELTEKTKILESGTVLHRIRAIRDIPIYSIKAGDVGGWIETENNLTHDGPAWVYGNAIVYDDAKISDNAIVFGTAVVCNHACVCGSARVYDSAVVSGYAYVYDHALIYGNTRTYGNAQIAGGARIYDNAHIAGYATVCGNAQVYGHAQVYDLVRIYHNAQVYGNAQVTDNVHIYDDAHVYGDASVRGDATIGGNARVKSGCDYAVYKNTWSSFRWFTYTRSNKMWQVGCFYGTGTELIAKAYKDSKKSGECYKAIVHAQTAIDETIEKEENAISTIKGRLQC